MKFLKYLRIVFWHEILSPKKILKMANNKKGKAKNGQHYHANHGFTAARAGRLRGEDFSVTVRPLPIGTMIEVVSGEVKHLLTGNQHSLS